MTRYNVLIVAQWVVGGIRTFLRYVYNNIDPKSYRFHLVAPRTEELDVLRNDLCNIDIGFSAVTFNTRKPRIDFRSIYNALKIEKFDLIHSHGFTAGLYCTPLAKIFRIPHVMTAHAMLKEDNFLGYKGRLLKIMLKYLFGNIDRIHSVSEGAKENVLFYYPDIKSSKFVLIPNGIEIDRFSKDEKRNFIKELKLPEGAFLIGFLGRFMPEKGFTVLLDAFKIVLENELRGKIPYLIAISDKGYKDRMMRIIKEMDMNEFVHILPFVDNAAPSIKGFDLVVMPSLSEAAPLLAMEVMVSGVPLIGTDIPGLKEFLINTPSTMVPPNNVNSLASAVLAEMKSSRKDFAEEYRKEAIVRFDVKRQAKQLEELYASMVTRSKQMK